MIVGITILFFKKGQITELDTDRHTFQSFHMGSMFTIVVYAGERSLAEKASNAAFDRIEELNSIMSDYMEDSELNRLSRRSGSGEEVQVSEPLFEVMKEAKRVSEMTDGLFDVTIGPLTKYWREIRAMSEPALPEADTLKNLLDRVGYQYVKLDESRQTVELLKPGMRLDLGGIAKGYAAEEALNVLEQFGIRSALVDAGGDMAVGAPPPGSGYWEVALPKGQVDGEKRYITLNLYETNVTTSGDMYQYVEIDGQRYSHILNPRTGLGVTDPIQATVVAGRGVLADALASAVALMDPDFGIMFINNLEETEAIIFKNTIEGRLESEALQEWKTAGFERYLK